MCIIRAARAKITLFDTIDLQECAGHKVHIHMKEIVYIPPPFSFNLRNKAAADIVHDRSHSLYIAFHEGIQIWASLLQHALIYSLSVYPEFGL